MPRDRPGERSFAGYSQNAPGGRLRSTSRKARWSRLLYLARLPAQIPYGGRLERARRGNKDLGKPHYATANGIVVLARDMRMGWGNLIIIRHIFLEDRQMRTADSAYAHLDRILVREGQQIVRGQQIGSIGTNRGMYTAHLHFRGAKKPLHWLQPERFRKGLLELLHAQLVHRSAPQAFRIGRSAPSRSIHST